MMRPWNVYHSGRNTDKQQCHINIRLVFRISWPGLGIQLMPQKAGFHSSCRHHGADKEVSTSAATFDIKMPTCADPVVPSEQEKPCTPAYVTWQQAFFLKARLYWIWLQGKSELLHWWVKAHTKICFWNVTTTVNSKKNRKKSEDAERC